MMVGPTFGPPRGKVARCVFPPDGLELFNLILNQHVPIGYSSLLWIRGLVPRSDETITRLRFKRI